MLQRVTAHYEVLEKLGEGGMGVVYKARDLRLERIVALKVLPADKVADAERKRRFMREAKTASALNHPNIITIYDIDSDQGVDFIAMEYVAGRTLDKLNPRQGMRPAEVLRYAVQIADALAAAHAAGIIHRDLKPGNIMLADSGLVKVLDFGLAKLTEKTVTGEDGPTQTLGAAPETEEGQILGTTAYMSPEQAQGLKLDGRSDIFSFGAVLYEMLTGRRAFSGDTRVSTIAAVLNHEPQPLAATTPRELDRIVTRCLKKDPARRFQTMADLKVALEELKEESDSGQLNAPAGPPARKMRWPLLAAGVAITGLTLAVGLWWLSSSHGPPSANRSTLRQLTHDEGDTGHPELSRDAKLVTYQSDRAEPGKYDIWVQQTTGGPAIRLTKDSADNVDPVFSGDGSKIYFNSMRTPQGIYEVPTLGGEARMVAANAANPSVSPDGDSLAYIGGPLDQLYIMPIEGGQARLAAPEYSAAGRPVWSPDGQEIAVFGVKTGQPQTKGWWVVPVDGGTPELTGWNRWAVDKGYPAGGLLGWLPGDVGISWLQKGDTIRIYRTRVSRGRGRPIIGDPEPLTFGTAREDYCSVAAGKMAFQSGVLSGELWSLPADTNQGRVTGAPQRLTSEKAPHCCPSLTPDGNTLVFSAQRTDSMNIYLRDIRSGQEHVLVSHPEQEEPLISADGSRVVYTMFKGVHWPVYEVSTTGGPPRKVCDDCGPSMSLSSDGKQFLAERIEGSRPHINSVDVNSGQSSVLLQHSRYSIDSGRFSPDGKWVAFLMDRGVSFGGGSLDAVVAPLSSAKAVPEKDWITVTSRPTALTDVFWSPDGKLLYYLSRQAGRSSAGYLMAQPLDGRHQPTGAPIQVHQFTERLHPDSQLTAVPGRIVGAMNFVNYNIWMMDLPK